jgi:hypothetical protein
MHRITSSGGRVTGISTSFNFTASLYQHRWRIDRERYACDPVGQTRTKCGAAATSHGRSHDGVRTPGNRYPDQVRTGSWPSLALPHTFAANGWLCTEIAVYNAAGGQWGSNAAGLPQGLRACAAVHA